MSDNPARVRMRIDLPVETWLQTFTFIPRLKVSNVVSYVSVYFSRIAHDLLHREGQIMLGNLCFKKGEYGQAELHVRRNRRVKIIVPFPDVPMPNNIVGFKLIKIKFVDWQVLAMLGRMRRLFDNVNSLRLHYDVDESVESERTVRMLSKICPLLGPVNTLYLASSSDIAELHRISPSILAGTTSLFIRKISAINAPAICDWLTTADSGDGEQDRTHEFLFLFYDVGSDVLAIMDHLKEKFLASSRPAPFFVGFFTLPSTIDGLTIANSKLHNPATDECLYIGEGPHVLSYAVVRYSRRDVPDEGKWAEWLEERFKQLNGARMDRNDNQAIVVKPDKTKKSLAQMVYSLLHA